jgi:hypothetical protein
VRLLGKVLAPAEVQPVCPHSLGLADRLAFARASGRSRRFFINGNGSNGTGQTKASPAVPHFMPGVPSARSCNMTLWVIDRGAGTGVGVDHALAPLLAHPIRRAQGKRHDKAPHPATRATSGIVAI